jgi:hypothetical protein
MKKRFHHIARGVLGVPPAFRKKTTLSTFWCDPKEEKTRHDVKVDGHGVEALLPLFKPF